TVCNMAIELGAKAGLIAPDQTTFDYIKGRKFSPQGNDLEAAIEYWATLKTDDNAKFDAVVTLNAADIKPQVTWGTNPGQVIAVDETIPSPDSFSDPVEKASAEKALAYMGLEAGKSLSDYKVDKVFVG